MTREQQIIQASIEYTTKNRPICISGNALSEVRDEINRNHAFEEGAKWADNHPKTVWHDAKLVTPPQDKEVIVLLDDIHCGSNYKIAFGHIVDKTRCVDYNGWNIPDVVCWMPCPKIPYQKDYEDNV